MPVKTKRDEEKWQKAKEIAAEKGKAENYAYIMGIYKKMKPDYEFKSGPDAKKASGPADASIGPYTAWLEYSGPRERVWGVYVDTEHRVAGEQVGAIVLGGAPRVYEARVGHGNLAYSRMKPLGTADDLQSALALFQRKRVAGRRPMKRRDEYKQLPRMTLRDLKDPNLYEATFTILGATYFLSKNMQGKWKAQIVQGGRRLNTRPMDPDPFWKAIMKSTEGSHPTRVEVRYTYETPIGPKKKAPSKAKGRTIQPGDVTSFLKGMRTPSGRLRDVYFDPPNYWSASPTNRERLDHYVGGFDYRDEDDEDYDPEGWNEDAWEEEYAGPLHRSVQKALDDRFGKGMFWVEIGEKGHVDVQATPKSGIGKAAARVAARYLVSRGAPLNPREEKDIQKANVWIMDWEMDGGTLPREIQRLTDTQRRLTPDEQRVVLDWYYSTAPGNY